MRDTRRPRVLYVQYTNPGGYPPLLHSARLLADAGFDVRMLGTVRPDNALAVPSHEGVRVDVMRFEPAGWRQKVHYVRYAAWVAETALSWRPDWIYASDPLACPATRVAQSLRRARVVYHEHDSPNPHAAEHGSRFWRHVMHAREVVGRGADICVLPNQERAEAFGAIVGRDDVMTVWNCPMPDEAAAPRAAGRPGVLRLVYHGSIVPSRLPMAVLDAIAGLPAGVTLDVIGYETVGHRGYVDALRVRAAELGLGERVEFIGALARHELMRRGATYDVGLSLLPRAASDPNQRTMTGASNKPFDYLAGGMALLVPDLADWRALFVDAGVARCCEWDGAASIQDAFRWFLDHPVEMRAMGERGRRQILAAWNYERLFAPVLEAMTRPAAARTAARPAAPAPWRVPRLTGAEETEHRARRH